MGKKKKTFLPEAFIAKFGAVMGGEKATFLEYCRIKLPKSLWVNGHKIAPNELKEKLEKQGWKLDMIPFTENGFDIIEGPVKPGQSPEFNEGLFNLQEKSAMLPAIVLNPGRGSFVIDACAAPGNKTLQVSNLMKNTGTLIACEKDKKRFRALAFNAKKFAMANVQPKLIDFTRLKLDKHADSILLDAPCSSEGLVRKDFKALKHWSENLVKRKAKQQKKLIVKAFEVLKPDGVLVYSTCSLSPEEDEEVVQHLLEKHPDARIEKITLNDFRLREGLAEWKGKKFDSQIRNCARVYPQDNNSQAFFMARIRKVK